MHDLYQIYRNLHYDFLPVSETELLLYVQHGTTLTEWRLTCIRDPREDRDTFYWDAKKVREYDSPLREPFHVIHSRDTTYLCSRSGDIHLFQDDQIVTVHRNENEAAYLLYRDLDTDSCYVIGREYYFRIAREITKQRFAGSSMAILRGLLPLTLENATP